MSDSEPNLPDIIWGVEAIGREAGVIDEKTGEVNLRRTQWKLERGHIPGWRRGRRWQSARSVIRKQLTEGAA